MENFLRNLLYRTILKHPDEREEGDDEAYPHVALRHRALDWLYLALGIFTHLYGAAATLLFFSRAGENWPVLTGTLGALQEPYLGGLGVYVLLKEIDKKRHGLPSRHYGEYFVTAWLGLFFVATLFVLFFADYKFDAVYKMIITNGLATLVIYVGGLVNKP